MKDTFKVLSFDLDDTLWPCAPTILNAEKKLFQWLSENVPVITNKYDAQQLLVKRRELLTNHPSLAHDLTSLRILSFEKLAIEFDLSFEWINPAFEIFYDARQNVSLFDDVGPVLDELSKQYKLVSVTNGNANTVKTGIDHWFDYSLNSAAIGKLKSEPDIYIKIQSHMNINPNQMIHIGDDPVQDILGAQSAGVFSIWLNREDKPWTLDSCEPDEEIKTLHELLVLIANLNTHC